jgi:hypothetical protein
MKIEFTDIYERCSESTGIRFYAIVDGRNIPCKVTLEALQDMNPKNRNDTIEEQFLLNQARLEEIAENKIRNKDSHILITTQDTINN